MPGIRIAIIAAALGLAACHDNGTGNTKVTGKGSKGESITSKIKALPRPSASEMDQVDNALDGRACIGKIQTWWRDYAYQLVEHLVDGKPVYNANVIEFLLIESKRKTTVASRSAGPPGSTHIRVEFVPTVVGSFQRSTRKLSIDYCEQHSKH